MKRINELAAATAETIRQNRLAMQREYRQKNAEKIRQYQREWRKKNPEKCKQYLENYWTKKALEAGKITQDEI